MATTTFQTERGTSYLREHERLQHTIGALRETLEARQSTRPRVVLLLVELEQMIHEHFANEEEHTGMFDEIVEQAPRLKSRADALLQQHQAMKHCLHAASWHAQRGVPSDSWWVELVSRFERFWTIFDRHEHAERALMQEAFCQDMGTED